MHLEVRPAGGLAWLGVFYGGGYGPRAEWPATVIAAPGGRAFFVLDEGAACRVGAHEPDRWEVVPVFPITGYHVAPDRAVVVFGSFQDLAAYGADGLLWVTDRLASDDVVVTGVRDGELIVSGWDGDDDADIVDLATGAVLERRRVRPPTPIWPWARRPWARRPS